MGKKIRKLYTIPFHLGLIIFVFDFLALTISSVLSNLYFPLFLHDNGDSLGSQIFNYYFFFNAVILFNFHYKGHYKNRVPWWQQVRAIMKSVLTIIVVTLITYYIFELKISLLYVFLSWILAIGLLLLGRSLSFSILPRFKSWTLPVTLFGDNQMVIDCMYAFYNDGQTGFSVRTIMLRDKIKKPICLNFIPETHPSINLVDASKDYLDYIKNNPESFYIIGLEGIRGENRDRLINTLENCDMDYAIVPPTKRLHLYGMEPHFFFGNDVMLLHGRRRVEEPFSRFVERTFDILVSGVCLPILGLMTAIVFIGKKLEGSETPIFYGGKRVGMNGREFNCWKFCTMRKDADQILNNLLDSDPELKKEWDEFQKLKNDPRVDSKISKKLRSTSLDELPQLWNVFVGDMSLVGPRPILPDQRNDYGEFLHLYESIRPGITGLWQVSGRNETTFQQRIFWDGWYIKNWSLWHDIVILFKTVSVLLTRRGAY